MLNQAFVLVVEDEPYIALDVAFAVEDADGQVVGPAGSVKEALAMLADEMIDAAILDVNLHDGDIAQVVEILSGRGVPLVLQTGIGLPPDLAARFEGLIVHLKPCDPDDMVRQIAAMLDAGEADRRAREKQA